MTTLPQRGSSLRRRRRCSQKMRISLRSSSSCARTRPRSTKEGSRCERTRRPLSPRQSPSSIATRHSSHSVRLRRRSPEPPVSSSFPRFASTLTPMRGPRFKRCCEPPQARGGPCALPRSPCFSRQAILSRLFWPRSKRSLRSSLRRARSTRRTWIGVTLSVRRTIKFWRRTSRPSRPWDKENLDWCNAEREENHKILEAHIAAIETLGQEISDLDILINDPETGLLAQIKQTEDALTANHESQVSETTKRSESNL